MSEESEINKSDKMPCLEWYRCTYNQRCIGESRLTMGTTEEIQACIRRASEKIIQIS